MIKELLQLLHLSDSDRLNTQNNMDSLSLGLNVLHTELTEILKLSTVDTSNMEAIKNPYEDRN